jgi:hypothetical protein
MQVIANLGYNAPPAVASGSSPGYVEERAALKAGLSLNKEGVTSSYLTAILSGSGVGTGQHVSPTQQGAFAGLYQKLGIIPTPTNSSVILPQAVAMLEQAHATTLEIENYLVQLYGFSWAVAEREAQAGFPIAGSGKPTKSPLPPPKEGLPSA